MFNTADPISIFLVLQLTTMLKAQYQLMSCVMGTCFFVPEKEIFKEVLHLIRVSLFAIENFHFKFIDDENMSENTARIDTGHVKFTFETPRPIQRIRIRMYYGRFHMSHVNHMIMTPW